MMLMMLMMKRKKRKGLTRRCQLRISVDGGWGGGVVYCTVFCMRIAVLIIQNTSLP